MKEGKPVIGWFCAYLPQEILLAGGFHSYRIMEGSACVSRGRACLSDNLCSYVLSSLEAALEGKYDFLDGLVIVNSCDAMRRLYDAWRHFVKKPAFVHLLDLPKKADEESIEYFRQCLFWLKEAIEAHYKIKLSDHSLKEAIAGVNRTRRLLGGLYGLRKADNPPVSAVEVSSIIKWALCDCLVGLRPPRNDSSETIKGAIIRLRQELNQELSSLLAQIKNRKKEPGLANARRARILITGGFIDQTELVRLIEGLGACVVCEELCTGIRYFEDLVDEQSEPLSALARRYLKRPPCARMLDADKRFDYLWRLVEEYRADGIIYYTLKFCDTNLFEFPYLRERLRQRQMPLLFLDSDAGAGYLGQMRTRVEAFLESLNMRREARV